MAEIQREIEYKDDYLDVTFFTTEYEIRNNSIGFYDYHGYTYYDNQPDYIEVTDFAYYKSDFSHEEQQAIDEYIRENESEIYDALSEKENEEYEECEPDYED